MIIVSIPRYAEFDLHKDMIYFKSDILRYMQFIYRKANRRKYTKELQLDRLEEYLQKTYKNPKINLKNILFAIIDNLSLNENSDIVLNNNYIYNISIQKLFNIIHYGNLEIPRNTVFHEAILQAQMRREIRRKRRALWV